MNVDGQFTLLYTDADLYLDADANNIAKWKTKSTVAGGNGCFRIVYCEVEPPNTQTAETDYKHQNNKSVYTMQGVRIKDDCNLPADIYIIDGKKVLVK